ncbi:MAG: YjbQ family protein, partial [Pseudomonadota bacterium]|nr:YjbQ family protein [Pseudomonadota bacterium]
MSVKSINIHAAHQGLFELTAQVNKIVQDSAIQEGLCTLFVRHTSASLLIQENADPSAKRDLEHWLNHAAISAGCLGPARSAAGTRSASWVPAP